jgi:CubicO group peptidase (beta-lactamase class C family)
MVYQRAAGFADRESGRPMRMDTLFRYASLTKPIVSAAAMSLVDRGTLSLNDEVTRWLPDFRPALPDGTRPPISLRQLLTHSSGLSYGFFEPPGGGPYRQAGISDGLDEPQRSMQDNLQRLASVPLLFAPGERWQYSLSLDVIGAVIERATDRPLPEAVWQLVTGPLQMGDTGFSLVDASRLAAPYADAPGEPQRMGERHVVDFGGGAGIVFTPERVFSREAYPSGGGGMVGSGPDFLRFVEAMRSGGAGIVRPDTVAQMMSNQIGEAPTFQPGWGFGIGAAVLKDPGQTATPQSAGTWEWGGVYGHSWFVDPVRRLSVAGLTNTAVEGMSGRFTVDVRDAVYATLNAAAR